MAIVQNPLIGAAKKSAGSMTFTRIKGQNILKTKAMTVKNPNTVAQQNNRRRFLLISLFALGVAMFKNYTLPELRNFPGGADLAGKIKSAAKSCLSVSAGVVTWAGQYFTIGGNRLLSYLPTGLGLGSSQSMAVSWVSGQPGAQTGTDVRIKVHCFNLTTGAYFCFDNSGNGYEYADEEYAGDCPPGWSVGDKMSIALETYSNLTTAMAGEKYATGWLGRPDIVSAANCTGTILT